MGFVDERWECAGLSALSIGDDVIVTFDGEDCPGEVLDVRNGWILAKILVDPDLDFGSITARLDPQSLVMVRDRDVRLAD